MIFPASSYPKCLRICAVVLLWLVPATVAGQGRTCELHKLNLPDVWLHSLAPYDGGVLASDPLNLRVLHVESDGQVREAFTGLRYRNAPIPFTPSLIESVGEDQFLLGNGPAEYFEVEPSPPSPSLAEKKDGLASREFAAKNILRPLGAGVPSRDLLAGLYGWSATEDGHMIAFADTVRPNGEYASGFVWFRRSQPNKFVIVQEVDGQSPEMTFYFILEPYIATIGNKAYFLRMAERPGIYEWDASRSDKERLRRLGIPRKFRQRPVLPENEGRNSVKLLFEELTESTVPVGLFAWKRDLWLLGRKPIDDGGTEWTIDRINPGIPGVRSSKVVDTLYLPTQAEHLAVTPGDDYWNILIKSGVEAMGRQDVTGLLRIPREWLLDSTSPLLDKSPDVPCS